MDAAKLIETHGTDLALTLWPEWAWAITHLGKDVENRGRDLLASDRRLRATGGRLWIHAGKTVGGGELSYTDAWGAVIDTAEHAGWRCDRRTMVFYQGDQAVSAPIKPRRHLLPRAALVAVAQIRLILGPRSGPVAWKVDGQYGHVLRVMLVLTPPISCKGAQGLWSVSKQLWSAA